MAKSKESRFTITDETFIAASPFRKSITRFQKNGAFSDVTVIIEGKQLECHRFLLAGNSPYFESMFSCGMKESRASTVTLKDVSLDAFELILDYLYKGTMTVREHSFVGLLKTIDMLQFDEHLRSKVLKGVEAEIGSSSCLAIMQLGDSIRIKGISQKAKQHALKNFNGVVASRSFIDMPYDQLVTYLSDDELVVEEEAVFGAICKWIKADIEERNQHAAELLHCVRFCFMEPETLFQMKDDPLFTTVPEFDECLDVAKHHHMVPCRQEDEHYYNCKPRVCQITVTLVRSRSNIETYSSDILGVSFNVLKLTDEMETSAAKINRTHCCTVGKDLYLLVGKKMWMYLSSHEHWITLQDRKEDVTGSTLTFCGDNLYAIGGNNLNGQDKIDFTENTSTVIEMYNLSGQQWLKNHQRYHLVHPTASHSVVAFKNNLYVIGGMLPDKKASNILQIVSKHRVKIGPELPKTQFSPSALVLNGHIFSVGSGYCLKLDIETMTWAVLDSPSPSLQMGKLYTQAVAIGSKMCILGGKNADSVVVFDTQNGTYSLAEPLEKRTSFDGAVISVCNKHLIWL